MSDQTPNYINAQESADDLSQQEDKAGFPWGSILGFFGYSTFVSWSISIFFYAKSPLSMTFSSQENPYWALLLFIVITLVACIIIALASDFFMSMRRMITLGAVAVAALVVSFVVSIVIVHLVSLAIAYAALSVLWYSFLGTKTRVFLYSGGAFIVNGVLALLASTMVAQAVTILTIVLPLCSLALFFSILAVVEKNHEFITKKESQKRFNPHISGKLTTVLDGALFGFTIVLLTPLFAVWGWLAVAIALICVVVGVIVIADYRAKLKVSESVLLRTYILRLIPPMFFLVFFSDQSWVMPLMLCYLIFNLLLHFIFATSATAELVRFNQLAGVYEFGISKALVMAGIIIGILTAWIFNTGEAYRIGVIFAYLLVMCAFSAFVFKDNYPTYDREIDSAINERIPNDIGNWKRNIEQTADEFHLSPRQIEVFFMLAKGRNAEHIQKEFYISKATAKAHIYSIYRKTGVHSQQELIDLIESKAGTRKTRKKSNPSKEPPPPH